MDIEADVTLVLDDTSLTGALFFDSTGLFQVLEEATLVSTVFVEPSGLSLTQTLDDTVLNAVAYKELLALVFQSLARVTCVSTVVLGPAPPLPPVGRLYNLTGKVHDNGGAILCFVGWPNRTVEWRILEGEGTITPFTTFTDELGRASARFDAVGITGRVVVGVAFVP